ncbi:MAG: hypothetical protein OEY34_06700 [Cyclobacteriaceae bacterium]|nr:hypothetical protein [Cyclobacteriaceae bacterium]
MKGFSFLFFSFSLFFSLQTVAQIQTISKESPLKERLYFGGGVDLAISRSRDIIGASPLVGYMFTKSTSVGVGLTYQYVNYKFITGNINTSIYGYRFYLRQNLFPSIFIYAEYENLSYELDITVDGSPRIWIDTFYLGGGYYRPFSDKAGFFIMALYDVNNGNAYGSPWSFRSGFTFSPF